LFAEEEGSRKSEMSLIKMNAKTKSKVNTADSRNSKKKCNCPQNADSSADEPWKRADRG